MSLGISEMKTVGNLDDAPAQKMGIINRLLMALELPSSYKCVNRAWRVNVMG